MVTKVTGLSVMVTDNPVTFVTINLCHHQSSRRQRAPRLVRS